MKIAIQILQAIIALGLISTVLLQSGKSAGLSGTITGGAEAIFGKKKGMDEFFSKLSAGLAISFLIITLIAALVV